MTTITFFSEEARIVGFSCQDHAGYDVAGHDIVCAAISGAINLTECAINTVLGLSAHVTVSEKDAKVTLRLPNGLSDEADQLCQTLLVALMVSLTELREQYPDNITVLEV